MQHFNTTFHDYIQNFSQDISPELLQLYRDLGQLDTPPEDALLKQIQLNALTLAEVWSLIRLESPDAPLSHLTEAGKYFPEFDYKRFQLSQNLRSAVELAAQEKLALTSPLSIARKLHAVISGSSESSGKFRQNDLWIGGENIDSAKYVAPPAENIESHLTSIEESLPRFAEIPGLLMLGYMHSYSFLMLPFHEENMKWTALWTLYLSRRLRLPSARFLPFSIGVLSIRSRYSQGLLSSIVQNSNDWESQWIESLSVTIATSLRIVRQSKSFWDIARQSEEDFGKAKKHLIPLILFLSSHPYITLRDVCALTGLTKPNASLLIQKAEKVGILKIATFDKRNRVYVCETLVSAITGK